MEPRPTRTRLPRGSRAPQEPARQGLADLDDLRRRRPVLRPDRPAGNDLQSKRSAVSGRDGVQRGGGSVSRWQVGLSLQEELGAIACVAERHERSNGGARDAGTRAEIGREPLVEVAHGVIGSMLTLVERELEGQQAAGLEAEIRARDVAGRLHEQRGADQQSEGECDLGRHERRS